MPTTHESDVLSYFNAETREQAERHLYRYTDCGAWIAWHEWGIVIGSIVEGCDFGTATYPLRYANGFSHTDIGDRVNAVEKEAAAIWDWANVLKDKNGRRHPYGKTDAENGIDCPDVSRDYENYEQAERSS